jgi:hypothetical protein
MTMIGLAGRGTINYGSRFSCSDGSDGFLYLQKGFKRERMMRESLPWEKGNRKGMSCIQLFEEGIEGVKEHSDWNLSCEYSSGIILLSPSLHIVIECLTDFRINPHTIYEIFVSFKDGVRVTRKNEFQDEAEIVFSSWDETEVEDLWSIADQGLDFVKEELVDIPNSFSKV